MWDMNPLPGDPNRVKAEGQRLVAAAENMRKAAAALRRMNDGSTYRSEAIDAVRRNADDLALVMDDSRSRFHEAGQALVEYAPKLDAAQQRALRAINANGHTDVTGTAGKAATLKAASIALAANPLATPEERTAADLAYQRAKSRAMEHAAAAAAARGEYEQARADGDRAALEAMNRISAANKRSKLNDTFGDHFKNFKDRFLVPTLEAITTVLSVVGDIMTVVGVIVAFVPGLQAVGLALAAVGRIIKVVSVITATLQLLIGESSLGEFAAKMLFIAAGSLLKAGKALTGKTPSKPPNLFEGLTVKQGLSDSVARYKVGSILWDEGQKAVVKVGVDQAKDEAEDAFGSWLDTLGSPSHVWTTDDLASHDVSAVGTDFSSVDAQSIMTKNFGPDFVGDAPVVAGAVR
ncbi:hypothetical protein KDN32_17045 [Nocardioides sp. J2M5]|uniref:hypothetical protein n=1 Tax=Nocardioides palaemonis TaxID=2829810 RepID=UPI001BA7A924|nr:hypothetical protein [Nocardioides palaemonis]MBS2939450.1 hypothetical protein [Nocardioides palaemonis]